ncbi:MAG: trypsin-like peptidase domain-containing protein [Pyrinomonadaceae bacterium]
MKPILKSAFFILSLFAVVSYAQDFLPELVKRVKPSSVSIETFNSRGETVSRGSGFFIAIDRIITNRHVIERSSRVVITLVDGKKFVAKGVLAVDGEGDLALLQVDVPAGLARPLPIVARVPQEGESIVVIGNPFGLEGSVSDGIVSAVREISGYGKIIQITAPISPGSSGSPVVNMYGQVVGVATLQAAEGQSLNFAVPAQRILQLKVNDLQTISALSADTQKNKRANAERSYSQGVAQLSRDDYSRALPFFERASELDSNYAEAWYQAGFTYGALGRHQDALKASKQAAKLRPEWPETFINIGASSFALGDFKEAAEAYKTAIRLDGDNPETQYAYGLTLNKLNKPDEEILAYRRAIAIKPDHANALEKLGQAYFKKKRWNDAIATFDQLLIYKPESKNYNFLGESYYEVEKFDDALTAFNNAVGYDADFDQARYNLGRTYVKLKNSAMAQVQYEILRNSRSDWADRLLVLINP